MKRFLAIILLAAMILLVGCSAGQKSGNSQQNENTVTFTDALNREVTVAKNPKRTAALIGSFADVWQLSGGEVCAAVEDAWDDFGLDLPDAVKLGGAHSPSFEALLSANPDFVIASASTAADVEMKDQLENAGITVAYFDVDNFDDYLKMLDVCTDITGRKELYKQNGLDVKAKIDEIKADFSAQNLPENERSVLILRASSGFVKAKGSVGTILGEMLADLGCTNIADSDKSLLDNLSVESVIRSEPYRIFVVTMGNDTDAALDNLKRMIEENPAWGQLGAVKENRLHIMERRLFNIKPNAEWAVAYEKLAKILSGKD
ncbi:MAG: ABC transporter substrate-binding protein [Oscillospiraceae bacterium]